MTRAPRLLSISGLALALAAAACDSRENPAEPNRPALKITYVR